MAKLVIFLCVFMLLMALVNSATPNRQKHGGLSAIGRSFCFDKDDCQDVCRAKCGLYRVKKLKCKKKESNCKCECRKGKKFGIL